MSSRSAPDPPVAARPAPRLNPFAFPSETDFRFALLSAAVLGASLVLYSETFNALPLTRSTVEDQYAACTRQADANRAGPFGERAARVLAYSECTAAADRAQAGWVLGGVVVLVLVAGAMYWTAPGRKLRRQRLVALDQTSMPEVARSLATMSDEVGLRGQPVFVWNPLSGGTNGQAFGHVRRRYVALGTGLVTRFYTDPAAFRAVLLHEMAHIRNGDIDKTYFTFALWHAFLLAALAPFAISQAVSGRPFADVPAIGWRVIPLMLLVYLTRNAVLRTREVYADVRASTWDGEAGALRRVLSGLRSRPLPWWRGVWHVHPTPADRLRSIDDTRWLFRPGAWDALGTGLAAGIALPNVAALLSLLLPLPLAALRPLGAAIVFAPLAAAIVGAGVWRVVFAARAHGQPVPGVGHLGALLGLGLAIGHNLSFAATDFDQSPDALSGLPLIGLEVAWATWLAVSLALFFRWVADGAAPWLEIAAAGDSPLTKVWTGLSIVGCLLAAWLGVLFFVYLAVRTGGGVIDVGILAQDSAAADAPPEIVQAAMSMLVGFLVLLLFSLLVLCLYPLAAWLWRAQATSVARARWAWLDSDFHPQQVTAPVLPQPRMAVGAGVLAGAVGSVLTGLVFAVLFRARSDPALAEAWPNLIAGWVTVGQPFLTAVFDLAVAGLVAARTSRLGGLHGLLSAMTCGLLMTVATLVLLAGLGLLWTEPALVLAYASLLVIGCTCIALPFAVGVGALSARHP